MALSLPARHEPIPRCVDRERQLEAQPVGRPTRHANETGVHPPQMVERAERHAVLELVTASGGAKQDVVIVQVARSSRIASGSS